MKDAYSSMDKFESDMLACTEAEAVCTETDKRWGYDTWILIIKTGDRWWVHYFNSSCGDINTTAEPHRHWLALHNVALKLLVPQRAYFISSSPDPLLCRTIRPLCPACPSFSTY